jgi:hypothetical protein
MSRRPTTSKERAVEPSKTGKISDVFGMLKREGQPTRTIAEINAASGPSWTGVDGEQEDDATPQAVSRQKAEGK